MRRIIIPALLFLASCTQQPARAPETRLAAQENAGSCVLVPSGNGPSGSASVRAQPVVTGLEVPWDVAFLPGGSDWLVTERRGRLRLVRSGKLMAAPVMTVPTLASGEGGLLGIALDPGFAQNSIFYVYLTQESPSNETGNETGNESGNNTGIVNRVQRYRLSQDRLNATPEQIILDRIEGNVIHDGGRIRFGRDGMLYISTGDARNSAAARNSNSLNGKILRIAPDGSIPADNPEAGRPWYIKGLRNPQGFDWLDANTLIVVDHGPSGEYLGRTGGDEVNLARRGDDLGWPTTWHCESQPGLVAPLLSWIDAVPPNGALFYQGQDIPAWQGNILVASSGARHLHRLVLKAGGGLASHEVHLQGEPPQGLGRLRSILQGPGGEIYVTTSNCDGRGSCSEARDGIYRIFSP